MNDADLLEDAKVVAEFCVAEDREKLRRGVRILSAVYEGFSYLESKEFLATLEGASPAVQQMKRRLASDPVKRNQAKERFKDALKRLLESDEVFSLIAPADEQRLREVREIFESLKNPS